VGILAGLYQCRDGGSESLLEYSPDLPASRAADVVNRCRRHGIVLPTAELLDLTAVGCLLGAPPLGLEVVRRPVEPDLTRSERRSWRLHRELSSHLTRSSLQEWRPVIERNLRRLGDRVRGQPHLRNLERWTALVEGGDVLGLHRVLTGLDRDSIEMREVSPMSGLLSQEERSRVLAAG